MEVSERTLKAMMREAALEALHLAGVFSGEMSQSRAEQVYGIHFKEACADGRLTPVRQGKGPNGKKTYSTLEIVSALSADMLRADIQLKDINH